MSLVGARDTEFVTTFFALRKRPIKKREMEYAQWEELLAEFDELVEGIDVIPDTDYSELPDEVFVPMVEMQRTLAHLAPSLTADQLSEV